MSKVFALYEFLGLQNDGGLFSFGNAGLGSSFVGTHAQAVFMRQTADFFISHKHFLGLLSAVEKTILFLDRRWHLLLAARNKNGRVEVVCVHGNNDAWVRRLLNFSEQRSLDFGLGREILIEAIGIRIVIWHESSP